MSVFLSFCRVTALPSPPSLHFLDRSLFSAHSGVKVLIKVNCLSEVAVAEGDGAAAAAAAAAAALLFAALLLGAPRLGGSPCGCRSFTGP